MKYLLLLLLAGCTTLELVSMAEESDTVHYAAPFVPTEKLGSSTATITVVWVPAEYMNQYCGQSNSVACARQIGDQWIIWTEKPRSWNDTVRLRRLGHEVGHALGAGHE